MESKNIFKKNTCNIPQVALISKIHNMQWLKNSPPLPGHFKPKTNKGIVNKLREDLKTNELTTESTMSVPNISADDNLPLVNSTNIVSTTSDNKYTRDIESKIDERSIALESKGFVWNVRDNMTDFNKQILILQELENDEMISMAIEDSLLSLEMDQQLKSEEEENCKEQDTAECDLSLLEIKNCTSEVNQEDIHDNNNNDHLNIISEPDIKIRNIQSDTLSSKGTDKEDQSEHICLNKETDTSLNLKNSNEIVLANDNAAISTASTISKSNNESKEESKCEVKQLPGKKEVPKVITKNATPPSALNKKNNVILGQSTESKMKYGIKQSLKNLSTESVRKTPDKRNHESSQSVLNTSKVLRTKCNLQSKKEAVIIKHSPELTARHSAKNLQESEQNKTTLSNTVITTNSSTNSCTNKQYRANRMCYLSKKEKSGSTSQIHNHLTKTTPHTVKKLTNYSNSPNSAQSTNKQLLNMAETLPTHKKILKTSDSANKYEDMKQNTTLKNDKVTEIFTSKEECDNRSDILNKIFVDIIDKEINTSSIEVKKSSGNNITNLTNEHPTNECVELKRTNTNPFVEDFPNLSTLNNSQTYAKDFKDITDNDLSIKSTLDNVPSINIPYAYHVPQQNVQQEQIPPDPNFMRYIPDQFVMDCSVNTALPKFHPNANTMQLSQYGNMQTMSNAQVQNCSSQNVSPPSTGNTNTLQYQMPNVLSCSSQNVVQPLPNFCIHAMSQGEQFNLPAYGLNPAYFMNPICICRSNSFPLHPQNWNLQHNYSVPLQQNPYHVNYNSFCNQHVQSTNMIHKNTAASRPLQSPQQTQILHERNFQRNYGKSMSNSGCNIRNPQNNKIYDTNLQVQRSIMNTRESIDFKKEKLDGEFLSDKESNNLPMISPKACMNYGSGLSKNFNTIRPQMKYSGTTDSLSNCQYQYQRKDDCRYMSGEHLPPDSVMGRGKTRLTQPNQTRYKAQY